MALPPAAALLPRLRRIRERSEALIAGLEPEDLCLQGMADASPAKWHLGHTSWFFEEFLLGGALPDDRWRYLFNSYYEAVGPRQPRPQRGLLTRPPIAKVLAWRQSVTEALADLVETTSNRRSCSSMSSPGSCCRSARQPSSPTRTRSPMCAA